ncbi:hypothetical protein ACTWP5_11155 [Streptomyces sp. 4N509B]|uniref:hypothetical protein n=1 Tax=Streptomyces sp. 4N509B TaxID=3457413 RepID=UPI003FD58DCA
MGAAGSRPSRLLRATMFAALCVLLAATGHMLALGAPLPWWAPAVALPVVTLGAWLLAGRERAVPVVTSAAVVTQLALHLVFSLVTAACQPAGHLPVAGGWWSRLRCVLAGGLGERATGTAAVPAQHVEHAAQAPSVYGMAAAHLAAALLSGLWLAHGERAAFRIARAVGARLVAPLRLLCRPPLPVQPRRVAASGSRRRPRRAPTLRVVSTRGPPPGAAVA